MVIHAEEGKEFPYDPTFELNMIGFVVCGKVLVLAVSWENDVYSFFVDMKKDKLLYGVKCFSGEHEKLKLLPGIFRGGLIAFHWKYKYITDRPPVSCLFFIFA